MIDSIGGGGIASAVRAAIAAYERTGRMVDAAKFSLLLLIGFPDSRRLSVRRTTCHQDARLSPPTGE
jgi:hypothetical protein